jgi:hypothetical protein
MRRLRAGKNSGRAGIESGWEIDSSLTRIQAGQELLSDKKSEKSRGFRFYFSDCFFYFLLLIINLGGYSVGEKGARIFQSDFTFQSDFNQIVSQMTTLLLLKVFINPKLPQA